jgi:hypothetical protein
LGLSLPQAVAGQPWGCPTAKEDSTVNEMRLSNYDIYRQSQGDFGPAAPNKKAVKPTGELR